ncbi:1642_t:CDS:2 [Funneliformis geosporum]|uniref:Peroxisomal membrane protein PEX13 n=1 Tax=Funneliformis geosporum TaxID=1117311 RepID=A0A9W4WQP5_9GLOM|nr:1642_t:CDS:2 [Funneliformis geosporum]CAI2179209.1 3300_t:CDS:2 [Funneliformis geosporum]
MPSPPKPWERTGTATRTATNGGSPLINTTTQQTLAGTSTTSNIPPAVPARPSTMSSGFANRGYNSYGPGGAGAYGGTTSGGYSPYTNNYGSYGGGYGTPYSRYGSSTYSPYNRYSGYNSYNSYGGSYGSYGSYGSPYNRFGYMMGPGGPGVGPGGPGGPEEMSLTQRMEANTAAGFHMIESVVGAFGGFSQMLESTFFATHSSFMAMVGVVEQFGNLRNYLGQVLSVFALIRWIRHLWYKITGKRPPVNPGELTPGNFQQYQEVSKLSRRPILFFVLAVFGVPYLMHRFIQVISRRRQEQQLLDGSIPPEGAGNNSEIITTPVSQTNSSQPQNFEFCRAIYDFKGEPNVELSFIKGDIIAILSKTDLWGNPSQWWRGRLRNGEIEC